MDKQGLYRVLRMTRLDLIIVLFRVLLDNEDLMAPGAVTGWDFEIVD